MTNPIVTVPVSPHDPTWKELTRLHALNAELVAALEAFLAARQPFWHGEEMESATDKARGALAKAKADVMPMPKAGDVVGKRTVIRVFREQVLFGQEENGIENCGAYLTDLEEWFAYKAALAKAKAEA